MILYIVFKLFVKILDCAIYGINKMAEFITEPLYIIHARILAMLYSIETHRLAKMVIECEKGCITSKYANPDSLIEELEEMGFREVNVEDIGVGYEATLVNAKLGKKAVITWKCKTLRTRHIILSWSSCDS